MSSATFQFKGKIALVTGAGQGISYSHCLTFWLEKNICCHKHYVYSQVQWILGVKSLVNNLNAGRYHCEDVFTVLVIKKSVRRVWSLSTLTQYQCISDGRTDRWNHYINMEHDYECLLMSDNIHGLDLFIWINLFIKYYLEPCTTCYMEEINHH